MKVVGQRFDPLHWVVKTSWSDALAFFESTENTELKTTVASFFKKNDWKMRCFDKAGISASAEASRLEREAVDEQQDVGANTAILVSHTERKKEGMAKAREKRVPKVPMSTPLVQDAAPRRRLRLKTAGQPSDQGDVEAV